MVAPTLSDYQYQFKDNGFLINGGNTLPFIDVHKVQGLGMAEFDVHIDDIDGQHGSSIYAKYAKGRIVVIDGVLYANPSTIQVTLDTLSDNFLPTDVEAPFYFKQPGVAQRFLNAKALACHYDEDTLRRIGACPIQIQVGAGYPAKLSEKDSAVALTAGVSFGTINNGKIATYPKFVVTGAYSSLRFTNNAASGPLNLIYTAIAGDVTVLDFLNRTVTINGNLNNSVASGTWWSFDPGVGVSISYSVISGATPTSVTLTTYNGWL